MKLKKVDNGEIVIKIDQRYFRPTEVEQLQGDSQKAFKKLKWIPKISLEEIIKEMIIHDNNEAKKESFLKEGGYEVPKPIESIRKTQN